jgi:hypothetical protein
MKKFLALVVIAICLFSVDSKVSSTALDSVSPHVCQFGPTCPNDGANMTWCGTEYRSTMQCRTVQIYRCMICGKKWAICTD